ncbi:MAG TPA: glucosaminidase domain-containing protein [Spirochaetia bacterium]|jgi:hypothetical protein|nr:glucosaminidase domain-containing protein [Spirochaetia bacterium]
MPRAFVLLFLSFSSLAWASTPVSPFVMGPSVVPVYARASFLHTMNPQVDLATALNYSLLYEEEGSFEGVNPDLAFAQMLLETSFLKFGGQVRSGQNNFAGLGALDGGDKGLVFASPRLGIRAQIQHLKYYATTLPLKGTSINPRLGYVKRASAPTVWQLGRSWASDAEYGNKLLALEARMVAHAERPFARPARSPLPPMASPEVDRD